jgi:hypothetical protein
VEGTGEWRAVARAEQTSDSPYIRQSVSGGPQAARSTISGGPQAARSTIDGSLIVGMDDDMFSDLNVVQRTVTHSVAKLCFIQPDDRTYDKDYLDNYDFTEYGYSKSATDMVDLYLGSAYASSERK